MSLEIFWILFSYILFYLISMELFRVSVFILDKLDSWSSSRKCLILSNFSYLETCWEYSLIMFLMATGSVLISYFIPDFGNMSPFFLIIVNLRHLPVLLIILKNQHFIDFSLLPFWVFFCLFGFFFLVAPCSMQDLSSPTRD